MVPEDRSASTNAEDARDASSFASKKKAEDEMNRTPDSRTGTYLSTPQTAYAVFPDHLEKGNLESDGGTRDDSSIFVEPVGKRSSTISLAAAWPPPKSSSNPAEIRIVKKGDNLTKLIAEVYGSADDNLIELVRKSNPQIQNINRILVGTKIFFPDTAKPDKP